MSIEAIAQATGIAKRTLYARFDGKPAVFAAVLRQMVDGFIGVSDAAAPEVPQSLAGALGVMAARLTEAALRPEALALHRLIVTAGDRVADLPAMLARGGLREGIRRVGALLHAHRPDLSEDETTYLAEQFQHMVLAGPQRRALGMGEPLDVADLALWCERTVRLFMAGLGGTGDRDR